MWLMTCASLALAICLSASRGHAADEAADGPMLGTKDKLWGQIGIEYRLRLEVRDNADLDSSDGDTLLMALQRARLMAGLNWADWLSAFMQLQDSRALGYGNGSVFYDGNTDLHQAWAEIRVPGILSFKAGRQVLAYGDQRLVGGLEWHNVGRVFDAVKLRFTHPIGWLDVFGTVFTPDNLGNLKRATWFTGIYDQLSLLSGMIVFEQYVMGLFDTPGAMAPGVVYGPGVDSDTGPERAEITFGTRLALRGKGLAVTIEAAYQTGYHQVGFEHGTESIEHAAYALHGDIGYTFQVPTSPFIRIEVNHASGNDGNLTVQWKRFSNLFPTNHGHYGFMDLVNWSNAINGSLGAGLKPSDMLTLVVHWWVLARASKLDGWYDAGGKELSAPPDPSSPAARDDDLMLGHEVDLTLEIMLSGHAKIVSGFGLFVPQGFARTRGSDVQIWGYGMLMVNL
jgi:hypothetical protein